MNKELFLALLAALLGVCLQIMPTVFEFENGVPHEELKVDLSQFRKKGGSRYEYLSLKRGDKKTAELPEENLYEIVVMPVGFPRNATHNERDTFSVAAPNTGEGCKRTSNATYCSYHRPDLIGKTKFKITATPDNHYQIQALD